MFKVIERVAFCLYLVGVVFYFLRYNNSMDSGLPGHLCGAPVPVIRLSR